MAKKKKGKGYCRGLTPALASLAFLLALPSCELATTLAKPAGEAVGRGGQVIANPSVADANKDGKVSFGEILTYILGIGGAAAAAAVPGIAAFAKSTGNAAKLDSVQGQVALAQSHVDDAHDAITDLASKKS